MTKFQALDRCHAAFLLLLSGVFYLCLATAGPALAQKENLTVASNWLLHTDTENALYHHLTAQAFKQLDRRKENIQQIRTPAQWRARQEQVRRLLHQAIGPFPKKTPLNSQITRTVNKPGYQVEHLIYESRPNFPVTASLFIPDNLQKKAPAILFCTGHSQAAYDRPLYQQVILNLVQKGFIVLAFDPVSQGERVQYLNTETGKSQLGGSTAEHSYAGAQAFLFGSSQALHATWDGIRGIDYLLTRQEVDPQRIGVHGLSGGGTQAAYIGALDERVKALASSNYVVGHRRLLESIGPQDGEQNLHNGLAMGLDHADFFEVRAPRPSLIVSTTRDFFSIQGARETYAEVKRAYKVLGQPDNVGMVEDDYEHGYTEKTREGIYAFFQKHLNVPGSQADQKVDYLTQDEMQITPTGQVQSSSFKGETLFTLNSKKASTQIKQLKQARQNLSQHLPDVMEAASSLSGYRPPKEVGQPVFRGRYNRDGYVVEKYFIKGEGDYIIPYLLMIPAQGSNGKALLYLHPEGKTAQAAPGQAMETFVKEGYVVLAPDLLGIGEMGPGQTRWAIKNVAYPHWFLSVLTGRSVAGIRAGDVVRLAQTLKSQPNLHVQKVAAVAHGSLSSSLLHAAAFDTGISDITLVEPLISYRSMVMTKQYDPSHLLGTVAKALPAYDLPDLAAGLAPSKLLVINPADGSGRPADQPLINQEYAVTRAAYERAGTPHAFETRATPHKTITEEVASWLP